MVTFLPEKLSFKGLHIQTNRTCNTQCAHCICGPAEDVIINPGDIEILLSQTKRIDWLVVLGGEPSLVPNLVEHIANCLTKYYIDVAKIVIVSNGLHVTTPVVRAFRSLLMCASGEAYVEISNDEFHQPVPIHNFTYLAQYMKCVWQWDRSDPEDYKDFTVYYDSGQDFSHIPGAIPQPREHVFKSGFEFTGDILTLNSKGNICVGVRSYQNQDMEYVCHVSEIAQLPDGELVSKSKQAA